MFLRVIPQSATIFAGYPRLKANKNSEVNVTLPPGVLLNVYGATEGLDESAMFWKVRTINTDVGERYPGYALEDELDFR